MKCVLILLVVTMLWAGASLGRAEPWWVNYEANDFPEQEPGWERVHGSLPAERWIDNGVLFLDKWNTPNTYEYYQMTFDHPIDPQPQELFLLSWRLKVDSVSGYYDPGVGVTSDPVGSDWYRAAFGFRVDRVLSVFEHGVSAPIAPGVFHDYELRSADMRSYQLYIDGSLAIQGVFAEVFGPPRVGFGQAMDGASSLAEWDWVRFGVVPEPASLAIGLLGVLTWPRRSRRGGGAARAEDCCYA